MEKILLPFRQGVALPCAYFARHRIDKSPRPLSIAASNMRIVNRDAQSFTSLGPLASLSFEQPGMSYQASPRSRMTLRSSQGKLQKHAHLLLR